MLIATLPPVHQSALLSQIVAHPGVGGVRYNIGARSPFPARETLGRVVDATRRANKPLWVDLKGRQLRIVQWAVPTFGDVVLNHEFTVGRPAKMWFRGGEFSEIREVVGRRVFVDPPPPTAVGQGQAVNVDGPELEIRGYLTDEDEEYIEACRDLGIVDVMLSFVEQDSDIAAVRERLPGARPVLKIESQRGLRFIASKSASSAGCRLMAARDDLMINIGENKAEMLPALEMLIQHDSTAILASRVFSGVEKSGAPALADFCDIRLMENLGYRSFLLSDGLCQRHFADAARAWEDYRAVSDRRTP
jgi:pyruvate kinase